MQTLVCNTNYANFCAIVSQQLDFRCRHGYHIVAEYSSIIIQPIQRKSNHWNTHADDATLSACNSQHVLQQLWLHFTRGTSFTIKLRLQNVATKKTSFFTPSSGKCSRIFDTFTTNYNSTPFICSKLNGNLEFSDTDAEGEKKGGFR